MMARPLYNSTWREPVEVPRFWISSPSPAIAKRTAWIAATALRHDVPLVTHNRNDYLGVPDLKLISHA